MIITIAIIVGMMANIIIAKLVTINNKAYLLLCPHFQNSCASDLCRHNG